MEAASCAAIRAAWRTWIDRGRFDRTVLQFANEGLVRSARRCDVDCDRIIALTNAGKAAALGGRDPESLWARPWDGLWRLVVFDVPESEEALRTRLRRKLRSLNFGFLQQSVWLSPDPIDKVSEHLATHRINATRLTLLNARPSGGETDNDLVVGAWDFEKINAGYRMHGALLNEFPVHQGKEARQAWFRAECKAWSVATKIDPFLPRALLPLKYIGQSALANRRETFRRLINFDLSC